MKNKYSYTYTVLRYVHDVTSGEFVNVGVALHAPQARYLGAMCRPTIGRIKKVFPSVNIEHFKSMMRHIQNSFEERGERLSSELQFASPSGVLEIAQAVLPKDDSALQWSPSGSGRTDDPAQTLEKLFNRMVMRYEDKQASSNRTDDDVWRHFKKDLEGQRILQHFQPKTISVQDDEIEFQHSWKNGKWHCLEPVSFDMASADSIKDKAHRWMGQLASVQSASDPFKVYLLVGAPQQENLLPAFHRAMSMLQRSPVDKEIVFEKDALGLAARIAGEVAEHERSV